MNVLSLFWAPASPFVRKVMASAHELGFADRIEILDSAANPVDRDPRIQTYNPLARVPAARTAQGAMLFDSRVICEYLDSMPGDAGRPQLFPKGEARWQALRRQSLADGLLEAALLIRYETLLRPEELRWTLWTDKQGEKVNDALTAMAEDVPSPDQVDIGTISYACALGWLDFRFPRVNWRAGRRGLAAWQSAYDMRPSMISTRPKA